MSMTVEDARELYKKTFGKEVANSKRNDIDRIVKKVEEKEASSEPVEKEEEQQPEEETKQDAEESEEPVVKESLTTEDARPALESVRAIQEHFGLLNLNLRQKEVLDKCDMYDSERAIIEEFVKADLKDVDIVISKVELPDYLQPIFDKYGLNPAIMKDAKKLRECLMEGAESEEDKAKAEKYITQVTDYLEYYIDMKRKGIKLSQYDLAPEL